MEDKPAGIKSGFDFDAINDPTPRESFIKPEIQSNNPPIQENLNKA